MILNTKKIQEMHSALINCLKGFSFKKILLISCSLSFFMAANADNKDGGIEERQTAKPITGKTATATTFAMILNQGTAIDYNSFPIQSTQQDKKIKNIITLSVIEETNLFIPQDFTATINVKIEYGANSLPSSLNTIYQDLTVDYKKGEGVKYNAKQYFSFDGAEYVKVTVNGITAPAIGSFYLENVLILENEMRITRYFELPSSVPSPTISIVTPTDPVPDHLTINWSWPVNTGNNASQLEWAWIENEMEDNYKVGGVLNYDLVFKNSTRVDLAYNKLDYDIPLLYDGVGKLYYRLRAVNFKESGNRTDGPWNLGNAFSFNGHNNSLNWQVTTTFAEEGKRKSVIQYYDGSLRGRQTVTKDNSTNTVVTAETFYDGEGRPAIQILPAPGISSIIQYQANLNMFNGQGINQDPAEIFDMEPVATPNSLTPPLLTSSGTSKYYSPANPEINNGSNKNIPDADGYPYSVTRYTPDATGRVMTQSGIGVAHKMGSTHETKYYYGTPSQEELDGLFGTEVGNFTHYFKNMVKDANGQMSISYVDMHGRTIATALAGNAPGNLQALNINNSTQYPNQAGTNITRNLIDNSSNVVKGNSIESINSLLVPASTNYNFRYELNPQILQMAACDGANPATLCYDCLYDLEIAITDESGETAPIIKKFSNVSLNPDDNCNTAIPAFKDLITNNVSNIVTFTQSLQPGSYSIRKTLSISESSFQYYKGLYMTKAVCKTEQELIDSIYNVLLATSNCANPTPITCQSCLTALGSEATFTSNYLTSIGSPSPVPAQVANEIHAAYIQAQQNCNRLCSTISQSLPTIREMMLADMMPYSGQYAQANATNNTVGGVHTMYDKYNIFSIVNSSTQPFYKYPWNSSKVLDLYYDDTHNKDLTIHSGTTNYTFLNSTTPGDFTHLFKNSWASSLLPHHPEYDRLVFAETSLTPSYNWINSFMQADFTAAQNPTNDYLHPMAHDPYFVQNSADIGTMTTAIGNYMGMGVSMWQLAYGDVRCKSIVNTTLRQACYTSAPNTPPPYSGFSAAENDQAWQVFRGLYAAQRNSLVNKYIADHNALPSTDEADLVTQKFRLWFPRDNQQIAAQNEWSWWPTTEGGPPGGTPSGSTNVYDDRCSSYIVKWKTQLLQCAALASHPDKDAILAAITSRMKAVCVNGSNQANPYGASNVAPATPVTVTDRSFEDVIKNVFIQYGIINVNGIYDDKYCNPFVIDWPKPYGKGPKMVEGEMTGTVDSCNCKAFAKVTAEAAALNYNPAVLSSLNQYLLLQYGETLTQGMFDGLQHCNEIRHITCTERDTILTYHCNQTPPTCPSGKGVQRNIALKKGIGTTSSFACTELQDIIIKFHAKYGYPTGTNCQDLFVEVFNNSMSTSYTWADLLLVYWNDCGTVLDVCGSAPVYDCKELADLVTAFLEDPHGVRCQEAFTTYFNNHYGTSLTWEQIVAVYYDTCGIILDVCGPLYPCQELDDLITDFLSLYDVNDTTACQVAFTNFFNNHYGTNYTWADIQAIYLASCGIELDVCTPLCSITCTLTICDTTYTIEPYILPYPQPLPDFLKCGYTSNPHCISCAGLSAYTAEFKAQFTPQVNTAPIFTGSNLTPTQVQYNMNYARFINYRTGFQYDWLTYSQAAGNATPSCDLANYANNSAALQNVICGSPRPLADTITIHNGCESVYIMAISMAQDIYHIRQQALLAQFDAAYKAKCLAAKEIEQFTVNYTTSEYHYTLYYYDMAGNLVKTVPPKGVRPNFSTAYTTQVEADKISGTPNVRPHEFITQYRYNSLNQVTAQNTPDANTSNFYYDRLGRLVVSQNAEQQLHDKYSYTIYDDLGRISEVGEKPQSTSMSQATSQDDALLLSWLNGTGTKQQITLTVYDKKYTSICDPNPALSTLCQENLRNRVSYSMVFNSETEKVNNSDGTVGGGYNATYYTYDLHGNVDKLVQDYKGIAGMNNNNNRFKLITYDYDLVSGNVNQVNYQPDKPDAFYHKYNYDANNRIIEVFTSRDKILWEKDASYTHYKHGALERMELGQLRVQGLDYAYTLQGWLKGINNTALDPALELSGDGTSQTTVAKDVLSFALHYFDETVGSNNWIDYKPIGTTSAFARPGGAANLMSLYSGNIAAMSVNNAGLAKNISNNNSLPLLYNYHYDQLNRLVNMQTYKGLNTGTNQWSAIAIDDYKEAVSYDPNGNILTYNRKGAPTAGSPLEMDDLTYNYASATNQLKQVRDAVGATNYTEDIDDQTNVNNYTYDKIGNLTSDVAEGITNISWTVQGKIESITKSTGTIAYTYDAAGNRISKNVNNLTTIYVRDGRGNVMALYESNSNAAPVLKESDLYGSSRLGIVTQLTVQTQVSSIPDVGTAKLSTFTRGEKVFELSNHLGNVLTTISDKKIQHSTDNIVVDYYYADIITATDYYPFGMDMPGRQYNAVNSYRYGFNGKEKDSKDGVVQYDYGFRIYDPRLARFKSVDPLSPNYPYFTPYQFASNSPIANIDLDGLEGKCIITEQFKEKFIKESNILNDNLVKYAISQGQTVVMKLTYATGPDDKSSEDIVLSNGGLGADIFSFTAQTNGINKEMTNFGVGPGPQLLRAGRAELEPLTIHSRPPMGLMPRTTPDFDPGNPGVRKGIKTVQVEAVHGTSTGTTTSTQDLADTYFKGGKDEFRKPLDALRSIKSYLDGLPSGTVSISVTITVTMNATAGATLMQWRVDYMTDVLNRLTKIPYTFKKEFYPGQEDQHVSATATIPVTTTSNVIIGYNVVTQPVQQQTIGGKGVGDIENTGKPSRPIFQTTKPAKEGTIKWKK